MQIFDPNPPPDGQWRTLRSWQAMRCQDADGTFNCLFNFRAEMFASDGTSWFQIGGGGDGVRMKNIHVWDVGGWNLFQGPGQWRGGQGPVGQNESYPYQLGINGNYYNFCTAYMAFASTC
jgi:hypothetical protein